MLSALMEQVRMSNCHSASQNVSCAILKLSSEKLADKQRIVG